MFAELIFFLLDHRFFTRMIGVVIAILGVWMVYQQGLELQKMRAVPAKVDLSILPEAIQYNRAYYVSLTGGRWDCNSLQVQSASFDHPQIPNTSAIYLGGRPLAILAHFWGTLNCGDLQRQSLTGTIRMIEEPEIFDIRELNPAVERLPREMVVYDLCTMCGPALPFAGVISGALLVAFGLLIIPILRWLKPDLWEGDFGIYGLGPRWGVRRRR